MLVAAAALVITLLTLAVVLADRVTPLKRIRQRRARAEMLMHLASTTALWGRQVTDAEPGTPPFAEWGFEHPMVRLCWIYQLTPADLAQECWRLSRTLEGNALAAGYGDPWPVPVQPTSTQPTPTPPSFTQPRRWVDTP